MKEQWIELRKWLDRWNPWELRREIEELRLKIEAKDRYCQTTNERLSMAIKENIERKKRIETLEGKLECKTKECELEKECALRNAREIDRLRAEINAAIGLLQGVAKE